MLLDLEVRPRTMSGTVSGLTERGECFAGRERDGGEPCLLPRCHEHAADLFLGTAHFSGGKTRATPGRSVFTL